MNMTQNLAIYLLDDDAAFRRSVVFLLESVGCTVVEYESAEAFLAEHEDEGPPADMGCLLLDIRMPSMSGLALQQLLLGRGWESAIVFMTGHGDVEMAVQAMKSGACDFLEKPFKDQALLDAVDQAVRRTRDRQRENSRQSEAQARLERLSPREREVARLVALGSPNKVVAHKLGISEKTVHVHRQHIMEKARVGNATELTRLMLAADPDSLA
ncbi:response regulator transcription factor [Parapusillimonas granuli]|mgnify:CR=1 FL=1|uniref:Response regulator transcription factor n=1 Tax=Parapusillimonas granuli TaxID=380911 RepID=A0A853FTU6_9BURK|nr:response regulator [Parapusillimonas granuli]MBB5215025.1 FixJ family two-component response regulator [Parapusillimonas granuli]MEB2401122.1 response regulator [Alcaligenaceae bacterium]NYT49345.1 response regulator transcription factor [Parapusillimonas granuli]